VGKNTADVKNLFAQVIGQQKKSHAQSKGEKKFYAPVNCPTSQPPLKNHGPSLNCYTAG